MRVSETKVCMGEKGMENGQKARSRGEVRGFVEEEIRMAGEQGFIGGDEA